MSHIPKNKRELAMIMKRIPHLFTQKKYDPIPMQKETMALGQIYEKYISHSGVHRERIQKIWSGVSLVSPGGTMYGDLTEEYELSKQDFIYTEIADKCPYMKSIIEEMGGEGQRCRIMVIQPGGTLTWHCHGHSNKTGRYTGEMFARDSFEAIVHVPIIIPKEFSYEVIHVEDYQKFDFEKKPFPIHRKSYPAGEAWVFNAAHMHNVFNRSLTTPRYTLMLNLDIRVKKTYDIMMAAVRTYLEENDGPLL